MSVLEELYYGNISIAERAIKKGSEYDRLIKVGIEFENKLMKSMNKQQKELFENVFTTRFEQEDIMLTETFVEGFRLGAQIMLEVFSEPKRQLTSIYENE